MTRTFRWLFAFLLIATTVHADPRPNFVVITTDDVGRDWMSCYGGAHTTPHIDRLAQQGVRYETAWATPLGTPTQVTLLTGQYPFRHGWTRHHDVPSWGGAGLSPKRFTTFARVLREAGYHTIIGGKWQLNDIRRQPRALPDHGFREHCVWTGTSTNRPSTEKRHEDAHIVTNGRQTTVPNGSQAIQAFLVKFLQRKNQRPFLMYYSPAFTHETHVTIPPNPQLAPAQAQERFAARVTHLDRLVGELVATVDKAGLREKTLIVLIGNNGSAMAGSLQDSLIPAGAGQTSDRGVHIPFIVRAPFLADGKRVSRDLLDVTDIFPTFLQLAQVEAPAEWTLDGRSLVASLRGSDDPFEKRNWIYSQLGDVRMIRDWQHFVDNRGRFHDLIKDPLQRHPVSPLDKIAPGRRQRLQMILKRFPPNAPPPFPEFAISPTTPTDQPPNGSRESKSQSKR